MISPGGDDVRVCLPIGCKECNLLGAKYARGTQTYHPYTPYNTPDTRAYFFCLNPNYFLGSVFRGEVKSEYIAPLIRLIKIRPNVPHSIAVADVAGRVEALGRNVKQLCQVIRYSVIYPNMALPLF
jgi:hypothetical protein